MEADHNFKDSGLETNLADVQEKKVFITHLAPWQLTREIEGHTTTTNS